MPPWERGGVSNGRAGRLGGAQLIICVLGGSILG